jgi:hypothetical protein
MLKYNILLAVTGMKSPFYLGNAGLLLSISCGLNERLLSFTDGIQSLPVVFQTIIAQLSQIPTGAASRAQS